MAKLKDIEDKVSDATGIAKTIIHEITKEFFKQLLYTLDEDPKNSVTISGFGTIKLKDNNYPGGPIIEGYEPGTKSDKAKILKITISRTLADRAKEMGFRKAVRAVWGEEFEYVRGRAIRRE